jgi:hypothetical protein
MGVWIVRRRLAEVDDDIEEATRMNDIARVELTGTYCRYTPDPRAPILWHL